MRYFDCHLHLENPTNQGFDGLIAHLDREQHRMLGALLVVNSPDEAEIIEKRRGELPATCDFVPYLPMDHLAPVSPNLTKLGWYKVHCSLQGITHERFSDVIACVERLPNLQGLMVHHFPWGCSLETNVALPLLIELAKRFPSLPILATHGGGYESWPLRAHTAPFPNLFYDFSVSLAYYAGTDYLVPFRIYLQKRRNRLVFGTDWPSAEFDQQWEEAVRLADDAGVGESALSDLFLANSQVLWPAAEAWKIQD